MYFLKSKGIASVELIKTDADIYTNRSIAYLGRIVHVIRMFLCVDAIRN